MTPRSPFVNTTITAIDREMPLRGRVIHYPEDEHCYEFYGVKVGVGDYELSFHVRDLTQVDALVADLTEQLEALKHTRPAPELAEVV